MADVDLVLDLVGGETQQRSFSVLKPGGRLVSSYVLSYSRRAYMRFVDSMDFTTTIREHVRAFEQTIDPRLANGERAENERPD